MQSLQDSLHSGLTLQCKKKWSNETDCLCRLYKFKELSQILGGFMFVENFIVKENVLFMFFVV